MFRKILLFSWLFILFLFSYGFSALDTNYVSWEVMEIKTNASGAVKMYVRFRLNIPLVEKYLERRLKETEELIKQGDPKRLEMLHRNWTNYSENLARYRKGKKLLKVWVFGDFNSWKTATSDIPNELIPSKSNPDTYYTKNLCEFDKGPKKKQYRYKFVLNYGTFIDKDGTEKDDFLYVEDPLCGDNKSDDGFGGFNSFFVYPY